MVQGTVADGDTTSDTDWTPITSEQLAKSTGKIRLEQFLQKLQSSSQKVLILSQIVCVLDFLGDPLRFKQSKYKSTDVSKSASHQTGAIDSLSTCHIKALSS